MKYFAVLLLALSGFTGFAQEAEPAKPAEKPVTPLTLPGAETHLYRTTGTEPMRLHVFKPEGWKPEDRRPALVFFFGGGWVKGSPEKSASWAKAAAAEGYVGIAPDYRCKDRFDTTPLESVADGRASVRWIQDHAKELGIDPTKIAVGGNSAGGLLALWTAIEKSPPGSSPDEAPKGKPAVVFLTAAVSDTSTATGYAPQRFGANTDALSAVLQLDAKMPPTLVFHGDADATVPYKQSVALRDKLVATGNVCELVTVPGGTHNFQGDLPEWKTKTRTLVFEFLRKQNLK